MKKFTLFVLMFLSFDLYATGRKGDDVSGSVPSVTGWQQQVQQQIQLQVQEQLQLQQQEATGSASIEGVNGGISTNKVITRVGGTSINNPQQTPFAYSPPTAIGYNPFKCTDSASLGFSFGGGAASGGVPISDGICEWLVKVDYLFRNGFTEEGCLLLAKDEELAEIFAKTKRQCIGVKQVVSKEQVQKVYPISEQLKRKYPEIN